MDEFTQLSNAPIQEGLIDLRTTFVATPSQEAFTAMAEELKASYPESVVLNRYEAQIKFGEGKPSAQSENRYAGLRLVSADKKYVFQAQIDGFTLSRLSPYSGWESLLQEAKMLWTVYEKHTRPSNVVRVAARYINRIELPVPITDFAEYFTAAPTLPPAMPQGISNYLVQLHIPDSELGAMIILTQTMEEVTGSNVVFVLDIDVFKISEFDIESKKWWLTLENLRRLKNRVFFSSLTEKTLERFK